MVGCAVLVGGFDEVMAHHYLLILSSIWMPLFGFSGLTAHLCWLVGRTQKRTPSFVTCFRCSLNLRSNLTHTVQAEKAVREMQVLPSPGHAFWLISNSIFPLAPPAGFGQPQVPPVPLLPEESQEIMWMKKMHHLIEIWQER